MGRPQFKRGGEIDKQLEELVKASLWKQAIALCEKRLKKGDKSDATLVAKAHVLLACPDATRQEQGRRELELLIRREPPILDVDVIITIHMFAFYRQDFQELLGPLWARAAKARLQDEALLKAWFETAFHTQMYKDAQQASLAYKSHFPQLHQAHFWYIVTCFLIAESEEFDETSREMNRRLAQRVLAKAAEAVATNGELPTSGWVLESLEDLLLLLRVYRSQGKFQDALEILDNGRTGIFSPLGNRDWQLVRQKIELLELSGQWQKMWCFCSKLLDDSYPEKLLGNPTAPNFVFGGVGDDWAVWTGLITATNRICTEDKFLQAEQYLNIFPKTSRNARIARLKLYASWAPETDETQRELLSSCREHFVDFSTKDVCFHDLYPYVLNLKQQHQAELLEAVSEHARNLRPGPNDVEPQFTSWITSETNVLKLLYCLCISKEPTRLDNEQLESFVCRCLRLYDISLYLNQELPITERHPADDAAILASMALIHVANSGPGAALLRSTAILETLLEGSKHNYDGLLIQIRLCLRLGLPSLALEHYVQLSVKNMQQATLSWILYTDISVIHPYPYMLQHSNTDDRPIMDLSENIASAIDWHAMADQTLSESTIKMLREGQYNMLIDTLALQRSLKIGFSKFLLVSERSRIQNVTGASIQKEYASILNDIGGQIYDNRDWAVFPNYEGNTDYPFLYLLGNIQDLPVDKTWVRRQLQLLIIDAIAGDDSPRIQPQVLERIRPEGAMSLDRELEPEKTHLKVLTIGASLQSVYTSSQKRSVARTAILENLDGLESLQVGGFGLLMWIHQHLDKCCVFLRPRLYVPLATYFKLIFSILDLCNTIKNIMARTIGWNNQERLVEPDYLKRSSAKITTMNQQVAVEAEMQASVMQKGLQGDQAREAIMAAVLCGHHEQPDWFGRELVSMTLKKNGMDIIAENMRISWIEALGGVMKAAKYLGRD